MNNCFDSTSGKLCCVPGGGQIKWPAGIRTLQREQAASGHWFLGVGRWDNVTPAEVERVQRIRNVPPVLRREAPGELGEEPATMHDASAQWQEENERIDGGVFVRSSAPSGSPQFPPPPPQ